MPLYEYQCPKCGRFEVIRKFSDAPLTECPTCGKAVTKLFSAPAIQFKGAGWYVTDYAKKSPNGEGTKSGESAPSAKDAPPSSKDSKETTGSSSSSSSSKDSSSKDVSAPSKNSSATSSASGSSPSK